MKRLGLIIIIAAVLCPCFMAGTHTSVEASSAASMVTIEASTGRVLYSQNMNQKRPMASVTKIATAITVLNKVSDIDKKVKIPLKAVGVEGSSIYLGADEMLSTRDLLYGLILQSGNDCAVALAISTAGSVEEFARLMNQTALDAGAKNTNFVNPHGLHDDKHYTTAYDLALITAYAMRNPVFKEIAATQSRRIERTRTDAPTLIINKNKLLKSFEGADGVKTGFTKKAGRCYVSSATRDGMQVISVVLNCGPMFEECASLMSRAFKEFKLTKVAGKNEYLTDVVVNGGKQKTVRAGALQDIYYPLRPGERLTLSFNRTDIAAPQKKGENAGEILFSLDNQLLFTQKLYTIEDAVGLSITDHIKDILTEW